MRRMNLIGDGDELVSRISLYKSRHPALHGYTSPFVLLYLAWLYTWLGVINVTLSHCFEELINCLVLV